MTQKTFSFITGVVFALVALTHLWRITQGITLTAEGTNIPMWTSWIAFIISGALSYFGFSFSMEPETPGTNKAA